VLSPAIERAVVDSARIEAAGADGGPACRRRGTSTGSRDLFRRCLLGGGGGDAAAAAAVFAVSIFSPAIERAAGGDGAGVVAAGADGAPRGGGAGDLRRHKIKSGII